MASDSAPHWHDVSFVNRDGLRLHARHYPASGSLCRPVLCLAGLTRNGRDFHDLAVLLSDPRGHRRAVYTLDSRGRGLSDHDPNWRNYVVPVEAHDALDFMTRVGLSDAAVIGTSRGGLVAMAMAAIRPTAIGAIILNDIGPVIERNGLARIMAYVGRVPLPISWDEAARLVVDLGREQFPNLTAADGQVLARQWFNEIAARPAPGYDPAIARALKLPDGPLPELWPQFGALSRVPALTLRGARSEVLAQSSLEEMTRRHPNLIGYTVPDEGHAPLLRDAATQAVIRDFLMQSDPA